MSKVLIVGPDRATIKLYEAAISFQGLETITTSDIKEAVNMIDQKPSLVLLDITTPNLGDINLIKELQEKDDIPLIIVADIKRDHALSEHSIEGVCEYLSKSDTSVGDIIKKVRKCIDEEKK
jgi:DNA-binding NtrC family response regulator